jgi:DNA-binding transcriptional LysR family regulator
VHIQDLGNEPFVLHHMCSTTEQKILRLFEQHNTRCRIVAELWSFENIKSFVQAQIGVAIVPKITVSQELRDGTLTRICVPELNMPRRTLMIYRENLSDAARELIKVVRGFNWESDRVKPVTLLKRRA